MQQSAEMSENNLTKHLNQIQLARRWSLSPRTLERWRVQKAGPAYLKIGGRVVYRLEDVAAFEAARLRQAKCQQPAPNFALQQRSATPC